MFLYDFVKIKLKNEIEISKKYSSALINLDFLFFNPVCNFFLNNYIS